MTKQNDFSAVQAQDEFFRTTARVPKLEDKLLRYLNMYKILDSITSDAVDPSMRRRAITTLGKKISATIEDWLSLVEK